MIKECSISLNSIGLNYKKVWILKDQNLEAEETTNSKCQGRKRSKKRCSLLTDFCHGSFPWFHSLPFRVDVLLHRVNQQHQRRIRTGHHTRIYWLHFTNWIMGSLYRYTSQQQISKYQYWLAGTKSNGNDRDCVQLRSSTNKTLGYSTRNRIYHRRSRQNHNVIKPLMEKCHSLKRYHLLKIYI